MKYTLAGWQVSGITSLQSGRPFTIGISTDNANVGARGKFQRPDLVGDPFRSGFTSTYGPGGTYYDTAAFALAPQYHFGNLGRNAMFGRSFYDTDLGIFKNFYLTERFKLQFRSEFFNAFNNVNFDVPGSNNNTFGDPAFGAVTQTVNSQRQIQFALKLLF
jgi:hypothetical protein